jgi:KaiC/GvpD/RAD55 family RecA-like ATPase
MENSPWTGVEEFVADGVIHFSTVPAGDARIRYLEITKMRGTNHQMGPIPIDIGPRGIRIVHPHVRGKLG